MVFLGSNFYSLVFLSASNDYTWFLFGSLLMPVLFKVFIGYSYRLDVVGFEFG